MAPGCRYRKDVTLAENAAFDRNPQKRREYFAMNLKRLVVNLFTHGIAGFIGFAAGIYALPIIIAPSAPSAEDVSAVANTAVFKGEFRRDLEDSDALHWGEGVVSIGPDNISLMGRLAPGPDYKLYFSPRFVETEADFNRLKPQMALVGDVKTFNNFLVAMPPGLNPGEYKSVIVWCETFGQFITAAKYR